MKHVLIAPDKFKNGATASQLALSLLEATDAFSDNLRVDIAPISDGGEGFVEILGNSLQGNFVSIPVVDALQRKTSAQFCEVPISAVPTDAWNLLDLKELKGGDGHIAIVEMAQASGIENLRPAERNPWKTTSFGTGQMLAQAAARGAKAILLGIGGSATNDCGMGALEALGVISYDRDLQPVTHITPQVFNQITTIGSTSHLIAKFPPLRIACDVQNPLIGEDGASAVFGPQKGLIPEDFSRMDRLIKKTATRILGLFGKPVSTWEKSMQEPGSGAAGGIGFALSHALPNAKLVNGFPLMTVLMKWDERIAEADVVVTGEGKLDQSSLTGKGPVALLKLTQKNQRILLLAGSVEAEAEVSLKQIYPNLDIITITPPDTKLEVALRDTVLNAKKCYTQWISNLL